MKKKKGDVVVQLPGTGRSPEFLLRDAAREDLEDVLILGRTNRKSTLILSTSCDPKFLALTLLVHQNIALKSINGDIERENNGKPRGAA